MLRFNEPEINGVMELDSDPDIDEYEEIEIDYGILSFHLPAAVQALTGLSNEVGFSFIDGMLYSTTYLDIEVVHGIESSTTRAAQI